MRLLKTLLSSLNREMGSCEQELGMRLAVLML
jgi:hypothetical protein